MLDAAIVSSQKAFEDIYLHGIPVLLRENSTAFLSLVCSMAAIDALAGWRHPAQMNVGARFVAFVEEYFPAAYKPHAANLYLLRCRVLHNLSPAHFSIVYAQPYNHLVKGPQDYFLSTESVFEDLRAAATKFFGEVQTTPAMQVTMLARLNDTKNGGSIYMS